MKMSILFLSYILILFNFLGLMPYNFICCQTGCILAQLNSLDELFTFSVIVKLCGVALVALLPGLIVKMFRKKKKSHKD